VPGASVRPGPVLQEPDSRGSAGSSRTRRIPPGARGATRAAVLLVLLPILPACPVAATVPEAAPRTAAGPPTAGTGAGSHASAVAPPSEVRAGDRPSDNGGAIVVTWRLSPDDRAGRGPVTGYEILRAPTAAGPYKLLGRVDAGTDEYVDLFAGEGKAFHYQVAALAGPVRAPAPPAGPAVATAQWFNRHRLSMLALILLLSAAIVHGILSARRGRLPRLRTLPGVGAMEEALAYAHDQGRPVLFITGVEDLNDIQTVAGLSVLKEVAGRAAERQVDLRVPHMHALVMAAAADTIEAGREAAGLPAPADPDENFYVSDEQFGQVAGSAGIMCRERPAACFYFGSFYAEALALAEIGQTIGAVQIAGTGQAAQMPFLLTACDHVLIGEEMFAASALLSRDPALLGSVRGQDLAKLLAIGLIGAGCLLATLAQITGAPALAGLRDALLSLLRSG
jgi:hypothetical protein